MLENSELHQASTCVRLARAESNTDLRAILLVMAKWWIELGKAGTKVSNAVRQQK
jgi:hypothetical protein